MAKNIIKKTMYPMIHNPLHYLTKRAENFGFDPSHVRVDFMGKRFSVAKSLYRRDFKAHYGCVNAIEFSNHGYYIVSGGDDRRVLLWNVEKAVSDIGEPVPMKGEHNSNIFCLAINKTNTKIYSGGNDEQVVLHDIESGESEDVFRHDEAVYGLSTDPNNDTIFASACDDGRVLIYDTREPATSDPFVLASYSSSMHAVMYNPAEPRLLATANAKEGVGLWDIRKPQSCLMRYGGRYLQQSCMSVRINSRGTHLVALRRRLPPVLYELSNTNPLCDMDHDGYYNSCTMKSCCFAGPNDEYVLSGSDDFNLYMWKIPDDLSQRVYQKEAHMILHGHRSIVNQVRYNPHNGIIISSGVEKVIKVWSPFPLQKGSGGIDCEAEDAVTERPVYTHEEYINLVLRSGLVMSHDYSSQSIEEDPRMMAFFDSLVQRELEYWSSEEDLSSNEIELYDSILQATRGTSQPEAGEGVQDSDNAASAPQVDGHVSDSSDNSDFSPFTLAFASVMAAQETDASRVLDAHDESERLRAAVQDHIELRARSSSRPRNRKSISEIIALNRKEVMRAAEMRNRNMRSSVDLHANILSSTSSDSDSDDLTTGSSRRVDNVSHLLRSRSTPQTRAVNRLKRLQALRTRLVTSDTDNSGNDSPACKRPRHGSNSSKEETPATWTDHCESHKALSSEKSTNHVKSDCGASTSQATSHIVSSVPKSKGVFEHEAGPYLQQTDGPGHSNHLPSLPSSSSASHPEPVASTSGSSAARPEEHPATADDHNSAHPVNGDSSCDAGGPQCSRPAHESDGESSQPVWNEFTRFKKRLKKASRYLRQRVQAQNESSDDD